MKPASPTGPPPARRAAHAGPPPPRAPPRTADASVTRRGAAPARAARSISGACARTRSPDGRASCRGGTRCTAATADALSRFLRTLPDILGARDLRAVRERLPPSPRAPPHRARHGRASDQGRAEPADHRSDGARHPRRRGDERRLHHPRLRARLSRRARPRTSAASVDHGEFGMAEETGRVLNHAATRGADARPRAGGRAAIIDARAAPSGELSILAAGVAARNSRHRARRRGHRHHPHAPVGRRRGDRRRQPRRLPPSRDRRQQLTRRLHQPRLGSDHSRSVSQGAQPGAQRRPSGRRAGDRRHGLHAPLPAGGERGAAADRRATARAFNSPDTTRSCSRCCGPRSRPRSA